MKFLILFFLISLSVYSQTRYDTISNQMTNLQKAYPTKITKFVLGKNDAKQDILGLRIGTSRRNSVNMLLVGTHHGNEGETANIAIQFSKLLAGKDLDNRVFFIIPVLNIPGYNKNQRWENSFDPNRDYPGPCKKKVDFRLKSTKALYDFVLANNFVASITLHGFIGIVAYPWGFSTRDVETLDNNYFIDISRDTANFAKYAYGNSTLEIYPADGCFEDWIYWKTGAWTLLFEIRNGSSSDIALNVNALEYYFFNINQSISNQHNFTGVCGQKLRDLFLE